MADPDAQDATKTATTVDSLDGAVPVSTEPRARGATIGRYLILEELGRGGMGVVYAAYDPELDRRVALKLIRDRDVAGGRRAARLIREAQAMARLSHPRVVTVFDAGTHGDEVYIAMALVRGVTLKEWLAAEPRSWSAVCRVFVDAGEGLAAAHRAGIVHRDFKPDNVLVGDDDRAVVTDFGLALPAGDDADADTDSDSDDETSPASPMLATRLTRTGALLGTPRYMSPEQHAGAATDARSDQFAFGVALFEALYGEPPFRGDTIEEVAAAATSGEIAEPDDRRIPAWLRRAVRQSLAADPDARFASMDELIAVLRREPRPPLGRAALGLVPLIAVAVLGIVAVRAGDRPALCASAAEHVDPVWNDDRERELREVFLATEHPAAEAAYRRVAADFGARAQAWTERRNEACRATHERGEQSAELLDLRIACFDARLDEMAGLVDVLTGGESGEVDGTTVEKAVAAVAALTPLSLCDDADALRKGVPPPTDPEERERVRALQQRLAGADARFGTGHYADALELAEPVIAELDTVDYPPLEADALFLLAELQSYTGADEEAEKTIYRAADAAARARDDFRVAKTWLLLLDQLEYTGQTDAIATLEPVARAAVARAGGDLRLEAELSSVLGQVNQGAGHYEAARDHFTRALELFRDGPAKDPLNVAATLNNLGGNAKARGELEEARGYLDESVAIYERELGPDHPALGRPLTHIGSVTRNLGDLDAAVSYYQRALALYERIYGSEAEILSGPLHGLGNVEALREDWDASDAYHERAMRIDERERGSDHPSLWVALYNLGRNATGRGDYAKARALYGRALALIEGAYGPESATAGTLLSALGNTATREELPDVARDYYARALAIQEEQLGADHPGVAETLYNVARLELDEGRAREALARFERAAEIFEGKLGPEHEYLAETLIDLGRCRVALGDAEGAVAALERADAIYAGKPALPARRGRAKLFLARAVWEARHDRAAAVSTATEARDLLAKDAAYAEDLAEARAFLAARGAE